MDVTASGSWLGINGVLEPRWQCSLCGAQIYSTAVTGDAVPLDCPVQLALDSMKEVMES